eukprot:3133467-Amphidinium_carterae.1
MNKAVAFAGDYGRCERKNSEVEMKSTVVAYTGEVIHTAERLEYDQIINALPPSDLSASIDVT